MKKFLREFKRINWRLTFFGSVRRTIITLILFIPILVYAASMGYQFYLQQNPQIIYAHKLQTLTQQVGKSLPLPKDETPVSATVTDTSVLPKQKFFSYAQNGDKILMYKKHKLAILYRPATGQVITEATLNFRDVTPTPPGGQGVAGASTSAGVAQSVSVVSSIPAQSTPQPTVPYHPQGKILIVPQQ